MRALGSRSLAALERPRNGWIAFGAVALASVAYSLYLTRGTTFYSDSLYLFDANRGLDLRVLVSEHNGQLILFPRLLYAVAFGLFGPSFLVIRIAEAVGVALVAAVLYALSSRHLGSALALAPAVFVLFLGYCADATLNATGIINVYCVLFGLVAILVLQARLRFAAPIAGLCLATALASWSAGLAFAAGVALVIARSPDRRRRAWVVAVPVALYALWWVARPGLHGPIYQGLGPAPVTNALLIPNFIADAAASVAATASGLVHNFQPPPTAVGPVLDTVWGPALAVLATVGLAIAWRRRPGSGWQWTWLLVLLIFWATTAFTVLPPVRLPEAGRYVYVGIVVAFALAASVLGPHRPGRRAIVIAVAWLAVALPVNIDDLRRAGSQLRSASEDQRADLAMIELAADHESPSFAPSTGILHNSFFTFAATADVYLAAVAHNGSIADTLPDLRAAAESAREEADQVLVEALGLHLAAPAGAGSPACRRVGPKTAGAGFRLPPGGAALRTAPGGAVTLRRFGSRFTVPLGALTAGEVSMVAIPTDSAPDPWWASVASGAAVDVCPLER